ncbi:MAG: DUF5666 domain-containing protein [Parcubacteria group bacterium]|jgi:hypothetical protein
MDTQEIKKDQEIKPEAKCGSCSPNCKSKTFKIAAIIIGVLLIILISFASGVGVGLKRGLFSCKWGENYERNFMGPQMDAGRPGPMGFMGPMMSEFGGSNFRNPHGLVGTIISISDGSLIVKDRDNKENTISVNDKTVIKLGRDDKKLSDLKIDDKITVIGQPGDDGVVNATLIRAFPFNQENQNN